MSRLRQAVEANGSKTILGVAVYFLRSDFLEICAYLGYQAIWIEMEHGCWLGLEIDLLFCSSILPA